MANKFQVFEIVFELQLFLILRFFCFFSFGYSQLSIYYALFCLEIEFELRFLPNALLKFKMSYSCLFATPP